MQQVLFLCSANYYRSRFAEHFFNWLAESHGLPWRAASRGLMTGHWGNIGPISHYTIAGLKARGIAINGNSREPLQVAEDDFAAATLVIALKEAEHRPVMADLFPAWADRIEYWHIDDLDCAAPEEALDTLDDRIRGLLTQLSIEGGSTSPD